jgi:hypothetical protein
MRVVFESIPDGKKVIKNSIEECLNEYEESLYKTALQFNSPITIGKTIAYAEPCPYCREDNEGTVVGLNMFKLNDTTIESYINGNTLDLAVVNIPEEFDEFFDVDSTVINFCPMCGRRLEKE